MEIDAKTKICGLIGYPVGHSVSPVIHNNLAGIYGQNLVYVPLQVETDRLEDAVKGAEAFGFLGMNVTVPYKSRIIPLLKGIDPLAEQIGAVNTLVRLEDGYKGYNTDMPGLYRAMCSDKVQIAGEDILLLGAGGVARAVAFLLLEKGAKHVTILNRSVDRAKALAEEVNKVAKGRKNALQNTDAFVTVLPLDGYQELDHTKQYIVIQATNVGMYPNVEEAVIEDEAFYRLVKVGYDIVFNPLNTRFMQLTRAAGGRAYHGLKMLLYQGVIAYELWTGVKVSEEAAADIYWKMEAALGLQ